MRLGLLDMIGLAASLIFAIPLGNYAVFRLLAGEVALGGGLLVVAVAMVVLPQYFLDPAQILRRLLSGLLPSQLRRDDAAVPETDDDSPSVAVESDSDDR